MLNTTEKMKEIISENIPRLTPEDLQVIGEEIERCLPFRYGNHGYLYLPNTDEFKEKYKKDINLFFELLNVFDNKLPFDELLKEYRCGENSLKSL